MISKRILVRMLGQSGCRFALPGTTIYFDPYLSNSVQELDSPDLARQIPIPFPPESVTDADWVLISHEHIDHCDPYTLPQIANASPQARFIGPYPVVARLLEWGINAGRIRLATENWLTLTDNIRILTIPAAHPEIERDEQGNPACVGYLLEYADQHLYLAGDTSAHQEIIDTLHKNNAAIHTAFLPVNEHNFFCGRREIIGNMSVREAFLFATEIGAKQVVAVHWDMFAANSVDPDEISFIYSRMAPRFNLLLSPKAINLAEVAVSIVIRTLNEAKYLEDLLKSIARQKTHGLHYEILVVDSGSTDGTLEIAKRYGCHIVHIQREEFSFGRSLNLGCEAAHGEIFVITSGHCVPTSENWLQHLCQPIIDEIADYSYGRQLGGPESHFSECRIFAKYYPEQSKVPQEEFFCNNANSAVSRRVWAHYRFDEDLTGLEDIKLAQRFVSEGGKVAYVAEACVYHFHHETWSQIRRRFEREAIALQSIMPQVHVDIVDTLRYVATSIWKDWLYAWRCPNGKCKLSDIVLYRWNQYIGSYKGNRQHRKLSRAEKEKYFYPE